MGGETINNNGENASNEHTDWQSLGHKIAEQIASHTTTDKNGEPVYLGRELPEEMQTKVEESGFVNPPEAPRGNKIDGREMSWDVYPRHEEESYTEYTNRLSTMNEKTREIIVDRMSEKVDSLFTNDTIDAVHNLLIDNNKFRNRYPSEDTREAIRNEVRDLVKGSIVERYAAIDEMEKDNYPTLYERAYYKKLANNDLGDVTKDDIEDIVYDTLNLEDYRVKNKLGGANGWNNKYGSGYKYHYESPIIAQELMSEKQRELFRGELQEEYISPSDLIKYNQNVIESAINEGDFLPDVIKTNPEAADEVLAKNEIDKNSDKITWLAINGAEASKKRQKSRITNYFNLNSRIAEMMENPDYDFSYKYGKLYREGKALDPIMSKGGIEKLKNIVTATSNEIANDGESIEKSKNEIREYKEKELTNRARNDDGIMNQVENLLEIHSINASINAEGFADNSSESAGLKKLIMAYYLENKSSIEIPVDYKTAIKRGFEERLALGIQKVGEHWENHDGGWHMIDEYKDYTKIFRSKHYAEVKDKIGINFEDEEYYDMAFTGFINALGSTNGYRSDAANWYYDEIFSKDPGKFLASLAAYRESDGCNRGMKNRITRFKNHRIDILEFQKQLVSEQNNDTENIKVTKTFEASREDVANILRKKQLSLLREHGIDKLDVSTTSFLPGSRDNETAEYGVGETPEMPIYDFGYEKVKALFAFAQHMDMNVPGSNVRYFINAFPRANNADEQNTQLEDVALDDSRSYIGFKFIRNGVECLMAESFAQGAGLYTAYDAGDGLDCNHIFNRTKQNAIKEKNIARTNHLDQAHYNESLNDSHQRSLKFIDKRTL